MRLGEKCLAGKVLQFVAAISCSLSGISDGMHYAWTAPVIPILRKSNSTIQIADADVLWLENMYMIGGFVGIPLTILTIDRFGRKRTILLGVVQGMISWFLIAFASSIEYLYVARVLSGIAGDVGFVAVPMYVGEISDKRIRGFLGSGVYLMMLVGIVVIYSLAPFVPIPLSSAFGCMFLVVEMIIIPCMPESPHYYILKEDREAARQSLIRLGYNNVEEELDEITEEVNMQQSNKHIADLVLRKNSRKALIIMTVLNIAQHFAGYSVMVMNLHSILGDTDTASNNIAIVYSILMLASALLASALVDKIGRKILLIVSSVMTGFSVLMLAIYFTLQSSGFKVEVSEWVPVASVMLFAISFKLGLGIVPIVSTGELFPIDVKAQGMTAADGVYMLSSTLSIYVYQEVKDNYGIHIPFFIFAGCCFLTAIFTIVFVPETKGKTLHEIQLILSGKPLPNECKDLELHTNDVKPNNKVPHNP
uniref:Major facilitator superfamily (MFS) profile domain-containing protein n=2 Tax=Photinus pyralis TaxID=7054 RepID=A0A1Y1KR51_PHOPY